MKKLIVSMMTAVALFAGSAAYAQTPSDGNTGATVQTEKSEKAGKKGTKDFKKSGKEGMRGNKGNQGPRFNPFDGVQLTPEQEQKLQVLQRGLGPVILDKEQQAKIKENKNLTPEEKKQLKKEKEAKKLEAKKNYLNGVKETLTPDQYVIFLENWYLYAPQNQGADKGFRQGRGSNNSRQVEKPVKDKK